MIISIYSEGVSNDRAARRLLPPPTPTPSLSLCQSDWYCSLHLVAWSKWYSSLSGSVSKLTLLWTASVVCHKTHEGFEWLWTEEPRRPQVTHAQRVQPPSEDKDMVTTTTGEGGRGATEGNWEKGGRTETERGRKKERERVRESQREREREKERDKVNLLQPLGFVISGNLMEVCH